MRLGLMPVAWKLSAHREVARTSRFVRMAWLDNGVAFRSRMIHVAYIDVACDWCDVERRSLDDMDGHEAEEACG